MQKGSVLDDQRVMTMCCGLARLGTNDTHSVPKSKREQYLLTPRYVSLLQQRKPKNVSVKAAHTMEKSELPNQERRKGHIARRTPGVPS